MHIAAVQNVTSEHSNHQNNDTNNRNHISLQKRPNGRLGNPSGARQNDVKNAS
jgi:hypothetical protein